ncbi:MULTISPECIES: helix-turn-helix domain-containing protein [Staphylococcus]|uniref:helix-turn-helix domain-containing protein n=1 Tax=Staphylococcus TaxID=1279 RepID=UPI0008A99578|nr:MULTISPECIES: helix-turn-helix transcriptional regulator [Staphylococcus]MDS3866370.1 helix-turn-helix transcriptional regulator [Staphylococcus hominis]OHO47906.1 transcriptional regulator [Staphylococcus sp. HMSC035D11]
MTIGDNIKKLRKERKMNQSEFAKSLNISQSYLSDIENGRKNLGINTVNNIAEKLGVTTSYLLSGNKMLRDLKGKEAQEQLLKLNKLINDETSNKEILLKNDLYELIKKDLSYSEVHYLNNVYNFYELEKTTKDNLLFISVLLQMLRENKMSKSKEAYNNLLNEFESFLKRYLDIK